MTNFIHFVELPSDNQLTKKQLYAKRYVARLKTDMVRYLKRREMNRIRQARNRCRKRNGVWDSVRLCETEVSKRSRKALKQLAKRGGVIPDVGLIEEMLDDAENAYDKMTKDQLITELRAKEAIIAEQVSFCKAQSYRC